MSSPPPKKHKGQESSPPSTTSCLYSLPDDTLGKIFCFLSTSTVLYRIQLVNRRFHHIVQTRKFIWKDIGLCSGFIPTASLHSLISKFGNFFGKLSLVAPHFEDEGLIQKLINVEILDLSTTFDMLCELMQPCHLKLKKLRFEVNEDLHNQRISSMKFLNWHSEPNYFRLLTSVKLSLINVQNDAYKTFLKMLPRCAPLIQKISLLLWHSCLDAEIFETIATDCKHLVSFKYTEELDAVSEEMVGDGVLKLVRNAQNLKTLYLNTYSLSVQGYKTLLRELPGLLSLKKLTLFNQRVMDSTDMEGDEEEQDEEETELCEVGDQKSSKEHSLLPKLSSVESLDMDLFDIPNHVTVKYWSYLFHEKLCHLCLTAWDENLVYLLLEVLPQINPNLETLEVNTGFVLKRQAVTSILNHFNQLSSLQFKSCELDNELFNKVIKKYKNSLKTLRFCSKYVLANILHMLCAERESKLIELDIHASAFPLAYEETEVHANNTLQRLTVAGIVSEDLVKHVCLIFPKLRRVLFDSPLLSITAVTAISRYLTTLDQFELQFTQHSCQDVLTVHKNTSIGAFYFQSISISLSCCLLLEIAFPNAPQFYHQSCPQYHALKLYVAEVLAPETTDEPAKHSLLTMCIAYLRCKILEHSIECLSESIDTENGLRVVGFTKSELEARTAKEKSRIDNAMIPTIQLLVSKHE